MKRSNTGQVKTSTPRKCAFPISPISQYDAQFPFFRKPHEIGAFSQDSSRKFKHDRSQLRYFCPPRQWVDLSYNLRDGYQTYDQRDESVKEYLDDLLRWVIQNKQLFSLQPQSKQSDVVKSPDTATQAQCNDHGQCLNTDFICWRGLLTRLLCTPYENREGWKVAVVRFNGTLYMCEFATEQKLQQIAEQTDTQKEMSYWGVKFEQYVTADKPGATADCSRRVNNKEAFCSVVRTRLNKHSLVFGGEVDCCEKQQREWKYVELKTSREIFHRKQDTNFKRFKLIKWWAQSFLIGVENIVCGFRDDDGVVRRLERIPTQSISKLCADIPNPWQPAVCFNFLDRFLQFVKDTVIKDDARVTYLFHWMPGQPIICEEQASGSMYEFLPAWYCRTTPTSQTETDTTTSTASQQLANNSRS